MVHVGNKSVWVIFMSYYSYLTDEGFRVENPKALLSITQLVCAKTGLAQCPCFYHCVTTLPRKCTSVKESKILCTLDDGWNILLETDLFCISSALL